MTETPADDTPATDPEVRDDVVVETADAVIAAAALEAAGGESAFATDGGEAEAVEEVGSEAVESVDSEEDDAAAEADADSEDGEDGDDDSEDGNDDADGAFGADESPEPEVVDDADDADGAVSSDNSANAEGPENADESYDEAGSDDADDSDDEDNDANDTVADDDADSNDHDDDEEAGADEDEDEDDGTPDANGVTPLAVASVVEAILFAAREPLKIAQIARAVGKRTRQDAVKEAIDELNVHYLETARAFEIAEISGRYQLMSRPEYAEHIMRIYPKRELTDKDKSHRLTPAALDTLAIIAYKQPVMRSEIEHIRGVACGPVLKALIERGSVREVGRRADLVGKPAVFGTTERFLAEFGLGSLDELPLRSEFQAFPGMEPPVEMTLIQPENADDNQATETEVEPVSAAEALATAGNGRAAAETRTDEASDDPTEESPPESSDTSSDASADEATDESSDALVDDLSVESTAEPSADPSDSQSGQPSGTPRVDPTENVPAESLPAGDGFDSDGDFDILASLPNGDGDDAATDDTGSAGESEPVPE